MGENIFLCFECGQRNRLNDSREKSSAKCGGCGQPLFAGKTKPVVQSGTEPASQGSKSGSGLVVAALSVTAGLAVIGFKMADDSGVAPTASSSYSVPPDPALPPGWTIVSEAPSSPLPPANIAATVPVVEPVAIEPGIVFNKTGQDGVAPFQIITSPGRNYFVKLVDAVGGADRIGVFVRGGSPMTVNVPLGSYQMRYASGEVWGGEDVLFGPGDLTSYAASPDTFSFRDNGLSYTGFTVELILQAHGNLETRPISADSF